MLPFDEHWCFVCRWIRPFQLYFVDSSGASVFSTGRRFLRSVAIASSSGGRFLIPFSAISRVAIAPCRALAPREYSPTIRGVFQPASRTRSIGYSVTTASTIRITLTPPQLGHFALKCKEGVRDLSADLVWSCVLIRVTYFVRCRNSPSVETVRS